MAAPQKTPSGSGASTRRPAHVVSSRDEVVNVLEHVYGPLFLSLALALFLLMSDAAHEVILAFTDSVIAAPGQILSNLLVWIPITILTVGSYFLAVRQQGAGRVKQMLLALVIWLAFFAVPLIVAYPRLLETLLGTGAGNRDLALAGQTLSFRFVDATDLGARVIFSVILFFYLPIILYRTTLWTLWAKRQGNLQPGDTYETFQPSPVGELALTAVGRLPLLGAAGGCLMVAFGSEATGGQVWVLCFMAAVFLYFAVLQRWFFPHLNEEVYDSGSRSMTFVWTLIGLFIGTSIIAAPVAEMAGPIAIASSFVMLAAVVLAALTLASARLIEWQVPLILILVALAIIAVGGTAALVVGVVFGVFCALNLLRPDGSWKWGVATLVGAVLAFGAYAYQRNSELCKTLAGCNIMQGAEAQDGWTDEGLTSVQEAYALWIANNPGVDTVTVVAAQGGGLFAGYHAAYDLAARQDATFGQQVTFADRVFAISGVSGGSVGAAVFWAIRASGLCDRDAATDTCYRDAVREVLSRDYLSGPLNRMLFSDALDTFIPWSTLFNDPVDRGDLLFERVNANVNRLLIREGHINDDNQDLLKKALRNSWTADGTAPMLFLNTTDLFTGERVIQSPASCFRPGCQIAEHNPAFGLPVARVAIVDSNDAERDLTVGEAAVLSARFPLVSPPGRYRECLDATCETIEQKQIADGGYFDNTGLETASDILSGMAQGDPSRPVSVLSYAILTPPADRGMMGTLGAPINGVVAATTARRRLTVARFCGQWEGDAVSNGLAARPQVTGTTALLDLTQEQTTHNFTLSWLLTESSGAAIERLVNTPGAGDRPLCSP